MGASVGVLEAAAPPSGGTVTPLEDPAPRVGGGNSVSGVRGVPLIAWRTNNAARQARSARAMRVFAGRDAGSFRD